LANRLRQLQGAGVIEKRLNEPGKNGEYHLTQAGQELFTVINSLRVWGEAWAFGDPAPEELDPVLLMWWMRGRANISLLPEERVVVQFKFHGAEKGTFWLVLNKEDVTLCLTDPGYELNLLVTADLATFYKLHAGRIQYNDALTHYDVKVEGIPSLTRAFPGWFGWGIEAPVEHMAQTLIGVT
jgi:hypothetical protein